MSSNSFPEYVRKRPRLHDNVLGFARRSPSENALGFSFGFTFIGETAVLIGGHWPPNETAVWFQRALEQICGYDRRSGRRIETAELDLMHLLFSGLILRFNRRPGRRIETAEWDIFKSVSFWDFDRRFRLTAESGRRLIPCFSRSIRRLNSAATTAEWNRRSVISRALWSFHLPCSWWL